MARYNKIYAGPVSENLPQVQEAPAAAAIMPGCLIVRTGGNFALATDTTTGKMFVAQDNYLIGGGVDDAYSPDETTIGMEMLDEQFFYLRFPSGVNVALDAPISTGASGKAAVAAAGDFVIGYAEEAYNNTSGQDQLVRVRAAKGHVLPA